MNADQYRSFIKEVLPPLGYQWRRFERRNTRRKIRRRMEQLGIHDPGVYAVLLSEDTREAGLFESLLTVTVTRFFRNARLWSDLADLLAEVARGLEPGTRNLRLWSSGCAGGEEAFTAAMMMEKVARSGIPGLNWEILGTDIDEHSLGRTLTAAYNWGAVREVPERFRQRWFTEENGMWTLCGDIRGMVEFQRHDAVREQPPGFFHVVLLRNSVLTYNTGEVQRTVLDRIHGCLIDPGLLVVGRTEKVPEGSEFEEIRPCIYKKVEV